jgi:hypothetical protein
MLAARLVATSHFAQAQLQSGARLRIDTLPAQCRTETLWRNLPGCCTRRAACGARLTHN